MKTKKKKCEGNYFSLVLGWKSVGRSFGRFKIRKRTGKVEQE